MENHRNNPENNNHDNLDLSMFKVNVNTVIDNLKKLGVIQMNVNPDMSIFQNGNLMNRNIIDTQSMTQPIIQFHNNNTIQTTNNNIITDLSPINQANSNYAKQNNNFLKNKKLREKEKKPKRKSLELYQSDDSEEIEEDYSYYSPSVSPKKKEWVNKNVKKASCNYEIEMSDLETSKIEEIKQIDESPKEKPQRIKENHKNSNNYKESDEINQERENLNGNSKHSYEHRQMMKYKRLQDDIKLLKRKNNEFDQITEENFPLKKKKKEKIEDFLYIKFKENDCDFIVIFISPLLIKPGIIDIMYFLPISEYFRYFTEENTNQFFSDLSLKLNIKPKENINDFILQKLKKEREIAVCQINSSIHFIIHFSAFPNLIRTELIIKEIKDQNLITLLNMKNANYLNNSVSRKDFRYNEQRESMFPSDKDGYPRDFDGKKEKMINDLKNELDNFKMKVESLNLEIGEYKKNNVLLDIKLNNNNSHFNMIQTQYKEKNDQLTQEKFILQNENKTLEDEIVKLNNKMKEENSIKEKYQLVISNLNSENEKSKEEMNVAIKEIQYLQDQIKKLSDSKIKIDDYLIEEVKNGSKTINPVSHDGTDDKMAEMKTCCILCCENRRDVLFVECSHSYCCFSCLKHSYKKKLIKKPKISENAYSSINDAICCAICKTDNNTFIKIIYS
jgi:hypothetical protein